MRVAVDFHAVPPHQDAIHARLLNWGHWCRRREGSGASPMFRSYRSTDVWAPASVSQPIDGLDAQRIAKGVAHLPEQHRHGIQWHYVRPVAPMRMCRALGLTAEGLAQLVVDGRQMLINRRA